MGGLKVPPEGGSGGGRGHSGMEHWTNTAEVKEGARLARRVADDRAIREGLTVASGPAGVDIAVRVEGAGAGCQDRADFFPFAGGYLLVLADGAGGISGGAEAAQFVLDHVRGLPQVNQDWSDVLLEADRRLASEPAAGETTAIIAFVREGNVVGSSVGDSGAWLLLPDDFVDLTEHQQRKPLLGSGRAVPVSFGSTPLRGRLVLGSDGLFKYVAPARICALAVLSSAEVATESLLDAARLPTGGLQDDVAVVVAG